MPSKITMVASFSLRSHPSANAIHVDASLTEETVVHAPNAVMRKKMNPIGSRNARKWIAPISPKIKVIMNLSTAEQQMYLTLAANALETIAMAKKQLLLTSSIDDRVMWRLFQKRGEANYIDSMKMLGMTYKLPSPLLNVNREEMLHYLTTRFATHIARKKYYNRKKLQLTHAKSN